MYVNSRIEKIFSLIKKTFVARNNVQVKPYMLNCEHFTTIYIFR